MVETQKLTTTSNIDLAIADVPNIDSIPDARKKLTIAYHATKALNDEYQAAKLSEALEDKIKILEAAYKLSAYKLLVESQLGRLIQKEQDAGRLATQGHNQYSSGSRSRTTTSIKTLADYGLTKQKGIEVGDKHLITADSLNIIVNRRMIGKSGPYLEPEAYFSNLKNALHFLVERRVRETELKDFKQVVDAVEKIHQDINAVLAKEPEVLKMFDGRGGQNGGTTTANTDVLQPCTVDKAVTKGEPIENDVPPSSVTKKCLVCGIDFTAKRRDAQFCSDKCRQISHRQGVSNV